MSAPGGLDLPELAIELTAKSFLLMAAALTVTWFMRRSSAAQRHLVLALAGGALLVLPMLSIAMPPWNLALVPSPFGPSFVAGAGGFSDEATPAADDPSPGAQGTMRAPLARGFDTVMPASPRWFRWLAGVWAAGAALLLLYFLASRLLTWWLARRAPPVEDTRVIEAARSVAERLGIGRPVTLAACNFFKVPFVSGVLSPRLIVPLEVTSWPADRLDAILHHELAHVRRRDVGVQFLAQLACCLYWLNPLSWVMERRLFIERERACDDVALTEDVDAADYAGHLMEVMEEMGNQRNVLWVTAAMAEGTDFKDRILSVLDPGARRGSPRLLYTVSVTVLTLLVLVPVAVVSPWFDATAHGAEATSAMQAYAQDEQTEPPAAPSEPPSVTSRDPSASPRREPAPNQPPVKRPESSAPGLGDHAAAALGRRGNSEALPALIAAVDDDSPEVREHAATALGHIGDPEAVPALVELLGDDSPKVREHAATALGLIGDRRAVRPLTKTLLGDVDARVREHAAQALGPLHDGSAVEALGRALRGDDEPRVREHAAIALGEIGDACAVTALSQALSDPSDRVRTTAAEALSVIQAGPPGALPPE